jgi:hypothetical protein
MVFSSALRVYCVDCNWLFSHSHAKSLRSFLKKNKWDCGTLKQMRFCIYEAIYNIIWFMYLAMANCEYLLPFRLFSDTQACLVREAVSCYHCKATTVKHLLYASRAFLEQQYNFDYVTCLVNEDSFSHILPDTQVQVGLPDDFTCQQPQDLMEMTRCTLLVVDLQKKIIGNSMDRICK